MHLWSMPSNRRTVNGLIRYDIVNNLLNMTAATYRSVFPVLRSSEGT